MIWSVLRQRCENRRFKSFAAYGGRGVSVAEEWAQFRAFHDWG